MIVIPRRKLVIFALFAIMCTVAVYISKAPYRSAFSAKTTKTVIIDAGHGLPDGGAVGMNGTIESTLNIKIAKLVQKDLEKKGYTVIMTRDGEETIAEGDMPIGKLKKADMNKRLDIMRDSDADMFVSIHMNKFTDSRYCGAQVIYSGNYPESKILAEILQKSLHTLSDNKSKRTHAKAPKGIFLLKNAPIPAVIVECGFLSNFDEEKLLNTEKYQKELAKAISDGIVNYYERTDKNESVRNG